MARAVRNWARANLCRSTMDTGIGLPERWQETTEQALDAQIDSTNAGTVRRTTASVWFKTAHMFTRTIKYALSDTRTSLIVRTKALADQYAPANPYARRGNPRGGRFARETRGATTVTHLNPLGVLGDNLAVPFVWMTDDEIQMFADHNVPVSHNPAAAMRVLGFARVPEMLDAGICVTIGTDGAPCNNRMTLIDDMWLTALIHKGRLLSPTTMPAQTILELVTTNAARAMLWDDQIGALAAGRKADLV